MFLGPPKTALVIAPHADDEVLGVGGLMARLSAEGWSVVVAYVTVSGFSSSATGGRSDSAARWEEACAACRVLGVSPHAVLFDTEAHHLKLDTVPQVELIGFIEGVLQETRPALLLIPAGGHFHQDHLAVCRTLG